MVSTEAKNQSTTALMLGDVFGKAGEIYPTLIEPVITEVIDTPYVFMPMEEFKSLGPQRMAQVYWLEMLYRAHWATTSNLVRHQRWFQSCRILSLERPNFLGFCASLRGLTEGAADASYSLGSVPETLANHYSDISAAVRGQPNSAMCSEELENMLIHFQFARTLDKKEDAPLTHQAETAARYIASIHTDSNPVTPMYRELCQLSHPAAQSIHWLTQADKSQWSVGYGNDLEQIADFCRRHLPTIEWVQMHSVNIPILILQVLNVFPFEALHTRAARKVDMSSTRLWAKIQAAFQRQGVFWNGQ